MKIRKEMENYFIMRNIGRDMYEVISRFTQLNLIMARYIHEHVHVHVIVHFYWHSKERKFNGLKCDDFIVQRVVQGSTY